jgi:hypothetical protein
MSFVFQTYNQRYLENIAAGGEPINDAGTYDVRIEQADVPEGEPYWRVIGVHHLTPEENRGKHYVFLEALDEEGRRVRDPFAWAGWTWEGRRPEERADPVPLDKPANEPANNIVMYFGQIVTVWLNGLVPDAADPSDRVENLHTNHPDEPGPGGELWNSIGHHSFYVVFQRTLQGDDGGGGEPPEPPEPHQGVIAGEVAGGRGYTVRLYQGETLIDTRTVGDDLSYRFEGLTPGVYRVEAIGPCLQQDGITLDEDKPVANVHLSV